MQERWVSGTCMNKGEDGSYTEGDVIYFNVPQLLKINEYRTSGGQTFTHIENDYLDVMLKEPISHFLPPMAT